MHVVVVVVVFISFHRQAEWGRVPGLEGGERQSYVGEQEEGECHQGKWGPCKQRLVQQTSINVARLSLLLFVCLSCCSNNCNNKRNLQHFQVALAA